MDRYLDLNMKHGDNVPPRVKVSQYEYGWNVYVNLYYENTTWTPPSGAVCYIQGTKKDNTGFSYVVSWANNIATIPLTNQMTVFEGDTRAEVLFMVNKQRIASANFIIEVEPAALSDDIQISETDIPIIERIPEVLDTLEEALEEVEEYASDSEAYAKGTRKGAAVPSSDPAYNNNSKYYSQQALNSASQASVYASRAATSATNAATSETNATNSASAAATSATNAYNSEVAAAASERAAANSASDASDSASEAEDWSELSRKWAVGPSGSGTSDPTDTNNSYYWAQQAKAEAEKFEGGVFYIASLNFAQLPALEDVDHGWLYNVKDEFTTTADFEEGAGILCPSGTNIICNKNNKWDLFNPNNVVTFNGRRGAVMPAAGDYTAAMVGAATDASVTAVFSEASTYDVDDYVMYKGQMYRCIAAVETAGPWDASKWVATDIMTEAGTQVLVDGVTILQNASTKVIYVNEFFFADEDAMREADGLGLIPDGATIRTPSSGSGGGGGGTGDVQSEAIADEFDTSIIYLAGQYAMYGGLLYRFTTSHSGTWSADDVAAVGVMSEITSLLSPIQTKLDAISIEL